MDSKVKCSIVEYLFTSGRSGWAEAVQKLYEDRNKEVRENQKIQDELTALYRSYQR